MSYGACSSDACICTKDSAAILPLAALALVYGFAVRALKGDLRAVVVAHTLQDFVVALLLLARPYLERYQPRP